MRTGRAIIISAILALGLAGPVMAVSTAAATAAPAAASAAALAKAPAYYYHS